MNRALKFPIVRLATRITIASWPERADYSVPRSRRFCFAAGRFARLRPAASAGAISATSRSSRGAASRDARSMSAVLTMFSTSLR